MKFLLLVLATAGCGRLGFDTVGPSDTKDAGDDGDDGPPIDPIDAPPGANVVTFGERPTSNIQGVTSDTHLTREVPKDSENFGASSALSLEGSESRALLRFDLTAIAPGASIVAARLHLDGTAESSGSTVTIAPVTESWIEGSQSGTAGVANWNQRAAAQSWTTLGANSPGSAGAQITSFIAPQVGSVGVDLPAAIAQSWVDMPGTNFGVVIASTGGDITLTSSESTTAGSRPELVVTYFP